MKLFPNAKINLGLNIVNKRSDGYHDIETIFYPVHFMTDELVIEKVDSSAGSEAVFYNSGLDVGGAPDDNLVVRAFRSIQKDFDLPEVSLSLLKRIPFGAGLGGGSADAAFTLKAVNTLFGLDLSDDDLEVYASRIGADCPFFIKNKPVFASGTGNVFTPVGLSLEGYYLVLVKPDIHVSTPAAYSMVKPAKPEVSLMECVKMPVSAWKNYIVNDFEKPVFEKYPEIGMIKDTLYDQGAVYASMSGSGSSVFGLFDSAPVVDNVFKRYAAFQGRF